MFRMKDTTYKAQIVTNYDVIPSDARSKNNFQCISIEKWILSEPLSDFNI